MNKLKVFKMGFLSKYSISVMSTALARKSAYFAARPLSEHAQFAQNVNKAPVQSNCNFVN